MDNSQQNIHRKHRWTIYLMYLNEISRCFGGFSSYFQLLIDAILLPHKRVGWANVILVMHGESEKIGSDTRKLFIDITS